MEEIFKLIIFIALIAGPAILKALGKGKGDPDEEEVALETRLEEAIRRAKDQVEGRKPTVTAPPPVAPMPTRDPSLRPIPSSKPRRNAPPPAPVAPPTPFRPRMAEPAKPVQPPPMPIPTRVPFEELSAEEEVVRARKQAASQSARVSKTVVEAEPVTEAGRHQKKFERLMTMNAYDMPAEKKRKEGRDARKKDRDRKPSRNELRRMIVYAELLKPPVSRRGHISTQAISSR